MNEAETRAELIDPLLVAAGWGVVEDSRIRREFPIAPGLIEGGGRRGKSLSADYVLSYRNTALAVVEAKADGLPLTEGVGQAKDYAAKLQLRFTYASNGLGIYAIDMESGEEGEAEGFPTPQELEIAVSRVLEAIASGHNRILLTLATGTGKTSIAFQIIWKLFQSRWNLSGQPSRRPRIMFLADRNNLADQAFNDFTAFAAFEENALARIEPDDLRKKGRVPTKEAADDPEGPKARPTKARIKLGDGKEHSIQLMLVTSFWHPDGRPMSSQQFIELLYRKLPEFVKDEAELRQLWSSPDTRRKLLQGLEEKGFGADQLAEMQRIIEAENSDLFDVLAYVAYALPPIPRESRAQQARLYIHSRFTSKQQLFLDFVLQHYVSSGVQELAQEKLTPLLRLRYQHSIADAVADLGKPEEIGQLFAGFQRFLYEPTR